MDLLWIMECSNMDICSNVMIGTGCQTKETIVVKGVLVHNILFCVYFFFLQKVQDSLMRKQQSTIIHYTLYKQIRICTYCKYI